VSGALIAFGFIAQSELRLAPFVAAVLPALFVLGELTFVALLRDSFQNVEFLRRIQKIRGYYRGLVPEAEEFFDPPGRDRETASAMATPGLGRRRHCCSLAPASSRRSTASSAAPVSRSSSHTRSGSTRLWSRRSASSPPCSYSACTWPTSTGAACLGSVGFAAG
jgi:hypothetical protein